MTDQRILSELSKHEGQPDSESSVLFVGSLVFWLVGLEILKFLLLFWFVCWLVLPPKYSGPGARVTPKCGTAHEYRQKSPKKGLHGLARGPGKRSRGIGSQQYFVFVLPTPDKHQQRSSGPLPSSRTSFSPC